jgi:glutamate--cysteine ligase
MKETKQPFSRFALNKSTEHAEEYRNSKLNDVDKQTFTNMAKESIAKQKDIESKQEIPFNDFLIHYFSQN